MVITLFGAVFGAGIAGLFDWVLFLSNDYFLNSGTRVPNGYDYLLVFGIVLLPLLGAILGGIGGYILHTQGKTISIFFTSAYILFPLMLLALIMTTFVLDSAITKRDATPHPQNNALILQLKNTSWIRTAKDSEIESLASSQPQQILNLTFDSQKQCTDGRSYTVMYKSGVEEKGCWNIASDTNVLALRTNTGTDFYQSIELSSTTLSFKSAGQTWIFTKK